MNPRYKISQKWTPFPQDFIDQIKHIYTQNFASKLGQSITVFVEGRIYSKEILMRVGLQNKGELRRFNFEVSLDLLTKEEDIIFNQLALGIDAIASLMTEYFANENDLELPYTWTETQFETAKVWIQHSTENSDLEAEANKLLGLLDESLVKNGDDTPSEDILDATEEQFDIFVDEMDPDASLVKKKKKEDLH